MESTDESHRQSPRTYGTFIRSLLRNPAVKHALLADFRRFLRRTFVILIAFAIGSPLLKTDGFPWRELLILTGLMFAYWLFRLQRTIATAYREASPSRSASRDH